jgi:hypothetical protein
MRHCQSSFIVSSRRPVPSGLVHSLHQQPQREEDFADGGHANDQHESGGEAGLGQQHQISNEPSDARDHQQDTEWLRNEAGSIDQPSQQQAVAAEQRQPYPVGAARRDKKGMSRRGGGTCMKAHKDSRSCKLQCRRAGSDDAAAEAE